jgi:phospholipase D1/2
MEKNSGVTFHQAQVALARIWVGPSSGLPDAQTTVAIKVSQPSAEGVVESSKEANKKVEAVAMPRTVEEARDILARFERGARGLRGDEGVEDSVAGHVMRERTGLLDEPWEGTPEEERNA